MAKGRIVPLTSLALLLLAAGLLGAPPATLALTCTLSLIVMVGFGTAHALGGFTGKRPLPRPTRLPPAEGEDAPPPLPGDPRASKEWLDTLEDIRSLPEVSGRRRRA